MTFELTIKVGSVLAEDVVHDDVQGRHDQLTEVICVDHHHGNLK